MKFPRLQIHVQSRIPLLGSEVKSLVRIVDELVDFEYRVRVLFILPMGGCSHLSVISFQEDIDAVYKGELNQKYK